MRIRYSALITTLAAAFFFVAPASPHHSNVAFEVTKVLTLTGEVTEFRWINPHTWIYIEGTAADGKVGEWAVEGAAPNSLIRRGWTKNSW